MDVGAEVNRLARAVETLAEAVALLAEGSADR
jgi:hypothetical protein